jgi:GNAT superfamily N-acetyltransferase
VTHIIIRDARPEDQPTLQVIFERASLSNVGDREMLTAHPEFLVLDVDLIGRGRTRVALVDDTIVGFASTSRSGDDGLELDDVFVDPDWRRHGAARELLVAIRREASAERVSRIDVTANEHAMDFYRAAGFESDGQVALEFGVGTRMHLPIE